MLAIIIINNMRLKLNLKLFPDYKSYLIKIKMGACTSRDRVPIVEGAHVRENFCYAAEAKLGLYRVEFRTYQAAIKRFGYRIDLTE